MYKCENPNCNNDVRVYGNKWCHDCQAAMNDKTIARLHAKMFITFIQTKGLWPCFLQIGEEPQKAGLSELFKLIDEFSEFVS